MSEEPLERSRKTIEDARRAADQARETEPFHREGLGEDPDEAEAAVAAPRAESDTDRTE